MPHFVILSRPDCGWCNKAKNFITSRGDTYQEFDIYENAQLREFLKANGVATVPQIFEDGEWIGGFEDLQAWVMDDVFADY